MAGRLDTADSLFSAGLAILGRLESPDWDEIARVPSYLANTRQMRLDVAGAIARAETADAATRALMDTLCGLRQPGSTPHYLKQISPPP